MSPLFSNEEYMAAINCGCPNCMKEAEDMCDQFEHQCWLEAVKTVQEYAEHRWMVRVKKTKVEKLLILTGGNRWYYGGKPVTDRQAERLVAKAYEDGISVASRGPRPVVVKA